MKQNHLLSISDLNGDEILSLIYNGVELKKKVWTETLKHKSLAILFEKQSARTRVSFDLAMNQQVQRQAAGKAILYAVEDVIVGDTSDWWARNLRDIPHQGEQIKRRHPVCTILTSSASPAGCLRQLHMKARQIEHELARISTQ